MMASTLCRLDNSGNLVELQRGRRWLGCLLVLSASQYCLHRLKLKRNDQIGRRAAEQKLRHDHNYDGHVMLTQFAPQAQYAVPSLIWVWPQEITSAKADRTIPALPEPLCREPMTTGVRLVRGLEGYFGEIWHDGTLLSIRWWTSAPTDADWQAFVRATGMRAWPDDLPAETAMVCPLPSDVPFRKDLVLGGADWVWRLKQLRASSFYLPIAALAGLVLAFQAGGAAGLMTKIHERTALLEAQQSEAESWLPLRRSALQARDDISRMMDERDSIALVYALIDLSYALKGQAATIQKIDLVNDRLSVTFEKPGLSDPVPVVEALEKSVSWQTVSYENNRQQIVGNVSGRLTDPNAAQEESKDDQ